MDTIFQVDPAIDANTINRYHVHAGRCRMSAVPAWMWAWGGQLEDAIAWDAAKQAARKRGLSLRYRRGQGARNNVCKLLRIGHMEIGRGGVVVCSETLGRWWSDQVDTTLVSKAIVRLMEQLDKQMI